MHRLRAAVVLLLVAAACAPPADAGSAQDPELTDPAGDQAVDRTIPAGVPQLSDDAFDDIDIVAAWFEQARADCAGDAEPGCLGLGLVVATTGAWTSTSKLTATFRLLRTQDSYAHSTANGQLVTLNVTGSSVTGVANATAAVTPEGLRIALPTLGAVGGDQLAGLNLSTSRTDPGLVTDAQATQDDATGTDEAGPASAFQVERPARLGRWSIRILSVDGQAGARAELTEPHDVAISYEVTNLGTDRSMYAVQVRGEGLPGFQGVAHTGELDPFGAARHNVTVTMGGAQPGDLRVRFLLGSTEPLATATIAYAPPAAERGVVPAGLDFLTPAAESTGLDDAFGKYAELAMLALLVLIVIIAVFLLVALAPSTLAGVAAPEAPPAAAGADAPPAGVLPPAAHVASAPHEEPPEAGPGITIESVSHEPDAPEEGEPVRTEVVVRNPGRTRQVRVVLSLDDRDEDDKAITLPARATKTVTLGWIAGPGENKVRVRVLPAA